jgi:hypothetical protein
MKAWNPELSAAELAAWRRRTIGFAIVLLLTALWAANMKGVATALYLVQMQDVPVLVLASLACLLTALWSPRWSLPERLPPDWMLLLAGCGLSALLASGTYALMGNYPLSRDEHMVVFDMAVFGKGRAATPIAPDWRPYALALVPEFLLNAKQPIGFVSAYLPINAMLRLAFSKIADPVWYNPLLVLLGGAALLDIARRTFGPQHRACVVVLLVYALSAQVLVNAMTTFSMTGHLALNLIWLAALLRGGRFWNAVAILTGFLAVGMHQLVFHPFFVAPFLVWKLRERQWKVALPYAAAYFAICLWWACYPMLLSAHVAQSAGQASQDNFLTERVLPLLLYRDPRTVGLTIFNSLRFIAWQNFALFPLLIAAVPVAVRQRGLARALLLGIVIWVVFLALVLPSQGRGWGYRYLNGYIGSFALLAGFGYRELEQRIGRQADGMVVLLSGLSVFAAIPLLFRSTYEFMQPRLATEGLIAGQPTPFVLIDSEISTSTDGRWRDTTDDYVRNLPDLSNRPLRFASSNLDEHLLVGLCRKAPITLITRRDVRAAGFMQNVSERSPKFDALVAAADRQAPGCFRRAVLPPAGDAQAARLGLIKAAATR